MLVKNIRIFKGIAIAKLDIPEDSMKMSSSTPNSPTATLFRFSHLPPFKTEESTRAGPKDCTLMAPKVIKVSTSVPNVNDPCQEKLGGTQGTSSSASGAKSLGDLDFVSDNLIKKF